MTKQSRSLTLSLGSKSGHGGSSRSSGTLTIHAEEAVSSRSVVEITFHCTNLDNKDLFSKSVSIHGITYGFEFCVVD